MIDFVSNQQQTATNSLLGLVGSSQSNQSAQTLTESGSGFADTLKAQMEPVAAEAPALKDEQPGVDEMTAMAAYAAAAVSAQSVPAQDAAVDNTSDMEVTDAQEALVLNIVEQNTETMTSDTAVDTVLDTVADSDAPPSADMTAVTAPVTDNDTDAASALPEETLSDITDVTFDVSAQDTEVQMKTDAATREPAAQPESDSAEADSADDAKVVQNTTQGAEEAAKPADTKQKTEVAATEQDTGDDTDALAKPEKEAEPKQNHRHDHHNRVDGHSRYMQWRVRHRSEANGETANEVPAVEQTEDTTKQADNTSVIPAETQPEEPVFNTESGKSSGDSEKNDQSELTRMSQTAAQTVKSEERPAFDTHVQSPETQKFFAEARNVNDQIIRSAQMNRFDGTSRLEIQLQPENLGKISISLAKNEMGVITAQIKTSNEQVSAMLRATLGELESSLKNMGINMDNIEITDSKAGWDSTNTNTNSNANTNERQQNRYAPRQTRSGADILRMSAMSPLTAALRMPYGAAVQNAYLTEELSVDYLA